MFYVYLLKVNNFYKIGVTKTSVEKRVNNLQTGNPYKIEIITSMKTSSEKEMFILEDMLHNEYKKYRGIGEWFELPNNILNELLLKYKAFEYPIILQEYKKLKGKLYQYSEKPTKRMRQGKVEEVTKKTIRAEINEVLLKCLNSNY